MSIRLNSDQQAALEAVQQGENIFLTGPAGSGKSTLVSAIVRWAHQVGKVCDVTAMTGCAALLLGNRAKTLHSWAGIGLGRGTAEQLTTEILRSSYTKKRWKRAHILVIDEISMMSPDLFEKLSQVGRQVRGGTAPWGGLQLILCGDFFQLPPVSKVVAPIGRFAFDAPAWTAAKLQPVVLTRIERQTDTSFQTVLNEARVGSLSTASVAILKSRQGLNWKERQIRPTLLFSRNADVNSINNDNLAALAKPVHTFDAETVIEAPKEDPTMELPTGDYLTKLIQRMDTDSSYVPHLELCEGAQVMLVYNMDMEKRLVNGSRGVIVGFRAGDGVPIVQFLHGDPVPIVHNEWVSNECPALKRRQIPLRVAYAVTIHKSQGATLDCALVDIGSSTFECGQAYVALSRVRDLESLYVWNFNPVKVMADPKVVAFYASLTGTTQTVSQTEEKDAVVSQENAVVSQEDAVVSQEDAVVSQEDAIESVETIVTETVSVTETEEVLADLENVMRVVSKAKAKAKAKPRAPRKASAPQPAPEVSGTLQSAALPTKAKVPRKKKETTDSAFAHPPATQPETSATLPTKARVPRKKKEVATIASE